MRAGCRWTEGAIVGIAICLLAAPAWSQAPPPRGSGDAPTTPTAPPSAIQSSPGPAVSAYPLELLGLLAPPAQRGPVTLTPSISISEEYDDNLFLDNENRQWDLITGFSPSITLFVNRPSYQLTGGYSFTAELYERESRFDNAFNRQNFIVSGLYQATQQLTLTVSDSFALDRNTNRVASQGFATGRQESWTNTFSPGMTLQMTPRTSLTLGATYGVLRFKRGSAEGGGAQGAGAGTDSDTYGFLSGLGYVLTPRLTGTIGYGFTFLDLRGEEDSRTHTPTLGVSYRLTPSLTGSVSGGPAITEIGGETFMSPAGTASLAQTLQFGTASVQYTRAVAAAGGLGGTTDTQTASGALTLPTLWRGLLVVLSPAYSIAESVGHGQTGRVDVRALTLNLAVTYQIARFASVFGGYTLLQQRTGGPSAVQADVDQNRVRFGLQFGYPINFD
jgi:hypothetical protein